jgi:hypothetical protein
MASRLVGEEIAGLRAGDAGDQDARTLIEDFGVKAPSGR